MEQDKPGDQPDSPGPQAGSEPVPQPVAGPVSQTWAEPVSETWAEPVSEPVSEPLRRRLADRIWGLRSMVAVALASVILGGVGGAAVAKAGDGADRGGGFAPGGQGGRQGGFGQQGGPGGFGHNGPGAQQGVLPQAPSSITPANPSKKR